MDVSDQLLYDAERERLSEYLHNEGYGAGQRPDIFIRDRQEYFRCELAS